MTRPLLSRNAIVGFALLTVSASGAHALDRSGGAGEGEALLETNCGRCHSIAATGTSPLEKAPPLREVYLKYPIEQLEEGFSEGMGSRHRDMPQIPFSPDQVSAILSYLGSITGIDPASRPRNPVPNETPP